MATTRLPFTKSQREELEHQALIFKYIVAGFPVPSDLLFPLRRTLISTSPLSELSSKSLSRVAPPHFAWNVYDMGLGRKIDPEPGRCRRTDGKKWRCSKESYPDSKYCERHMHRGKNRSRKPVEFSSTSSSLSSSASSSSSYVSATSSIFSFSNLKDYSNPSSLRLNNASLSRPLNNASRALNLDSSCSSCSFAVDDDPSGRKRDVYIDNFFSVEPSGSIRSFSGSTMDDKSWGFTPLARGVAAKDEKPSGHCFILGTDIATHETPLMIKKKMKQGEEDEEEGNKRVHRFLEERPSCNTSSVSTSLFI